VFFDWINVAHGGAYNHPGGGRFEEVGVAWLDWRLNRDQQAARMFQGPDCILCKDPIWRVEKRGMNWPTQALVLRRPSNFAWIPCGKPASVIPTLSDSDKLVRRSHETPGAAPAGRPAMRFWRWAAAALVAPGR
jgi:hypothetical protein